MAAEPTYDPTLASAITRLLQQRGGMPTARIVAGLATPAVLVDPGLLAWHLQRMPGVQARLVIGADGVGRKQWVLQEG